MIGKGQVRAIAVAVSLALAAAAASAGTPHQFGVSTAKAKRPSAIIGGDADAIIGGDADAIIGGDADAIIGGDADAIIGGDADAIIGGDADAIIGGDADAIIGGDADAIIGGDADAIIGGDADAIIGGDADAIIGGDADAIIGGDADAIIGGDADAIIGGDADAIIGGDADSTDRGRLANAVAKGIVAYGPIESVDVAKGQIRVLGQTYGAGSNTASLAALADHIASGYTVVAKVVGKPNKQGTAKASNLLLTSDTYTPGATSVLVSGTISRVSAETAQFTVGKLVVDYSGLLADGLVEVVPGQSVGISGVQVASGSALQAHAIKIF
jgi:hypothetical protein